MTESGGRLDLDSVVQRSTDLVHAEVDGEVTMMSVETGRYYGLTTVATRIWHLLEGPIRVGELCQRLQTEYRVTRERCEEEVLELLDHMLQEGVVTRPEVSTSPNTGDST